MMEIRFSIDDVIKSFLWLEKSKQESIFASYTFQFAKWLYEKYGIATTCNCLFSDGKLNLTNISDKWREQFQINSQWLKFSFHGWDFEKSYIDSTYTEALNDISTVDSEIIRICGKAALSDTIRTHFLAEARKRLMHGKMLELRKY